MHVTAGPHARVVAEDVPCRRTCLAAHRGGADHAVVNADSSTFLIPQPTIWTFVPLLVIVGMVVFISVDASRRNGSGLAWGLVAVFLGPIGWLLYLIFRPSRRPGPIE